MTTIKTTFHTYDFDVSKPEDRDAYETLRAQLKANSPHCMHAIGDHCHHYQPIDGRIIELETAFLFDNQWNTAPIDGFSEKGVRVFDWAEDAIFDDRGRERKDIRRGHWLEQTPEMREIRRNTMKCGYCGKQEPAAKGYVFCPHCLDSEYLTQDQLKLTRMRPIDESGPRGKFPELTEAEKAHLLPLYAEAQLHGSTERGKARIAKQRRDILAKRDETIAAAKTEYDGFLWLMDHGYNTDNVIYYSHTGRFGFGWRKKLSGEVLSRTLDLVCEFPFAYTIETADGRKLEN